LTFSTIITLVEALKTLDKKFRVVLTLETFVSLVAGYIYYKFLINIESEKDVIPWRYLDWFITTPVLLLSLIIMVHGLDIPWDLTILVIVLNEFMLLFGLLGELNYISRISACIYGFICLVALLLIIYFWIGVNENQAIYWFFVVLWSIYGFVYLLNDKIKFIIYNFLDVIAKAGLGLWTWVLATGLD
jgi:bacteriorhodopsin